MTSASAGSEKLDWLQCVRAVAALYVMFFHGKHWLVAAFPMATWMHEIARFGYMGVDIFFVLSGFVIGKSASNIHDLRSGARFFLKRVLRIYLGYWPVLAFTVLAMVWMAHTPEWGRWFRSIFLTGPAMIHHWLPVAWSLVYELYFYVIVTLVYAITPTRARLNVCVYLLIGLILWHMGWWWHNPKGVIAGQEPLRFLLSAHHIEFLFGLTLSQALTSRSIQASGIWISFGVILSMSGVVNWTVIAPNAETIFFRSTTLGLVGLGLVIAALGCEALKWRAPVALVRIGDASFTLYLLHPILIVLTDQRVIAPFPHLSAYVFIAFLVILGIAMLWFRAIEQPLYLWSLQKFRVQRLVGNQNRGQTA